MFITLLLGSYSSDGIMQGFLLLRNSTPLNKIYTNIKTLSNFANMIQPKKIKL